MMLDATRKFDEPLTEERLFAWHAALFPTGRSGMTRIRVGAWRDDNPDHAGCFRSFRQGKSSLSGSRGGRLDQEMSSSLSGSTQSKTAIRF